MFFIHLKWYHANPSDQVFYLLLLQEDRFSQQEGRQEKSVLTRRDNVDLVTLYEGPRGQPQVRRWYFCAQHKSICVVLWNPNTITWKVRIMATWYQLEISNPVSPIQVGKSLFFSPTLRWTSTYFYNLPGIIHLITMICVTMLLVTIKKVVKCSAQHCNFLGGKKPQETRVMCTYKQETKGLIRKDIIFT